MGSWNGGVSPLEYSPLQQLHQSLWAAVDKSSRASLSLAVWPEGSFTWNTESMQNTWETPEVLGKLPYLITNSSQSFPSPRKWSLNSRYSSSLERQRRLPKFRCLVHMDRNLAFNIGMYIHKSVYIYIWTCIYICGCTCIWTCTVYVHAYV